MLVLVQFPFADLRHFADPPAGPKIGADWSLPPEIENPDFVRGFGPLRKRPRSDAPALSAWLGEAWFARASGAIRFPQLSDRDFARAGVKLVPQLALRRVFCNGRALWRVELGLAFDPRTGPDFAQILAAVADFLRLPIRVKSRGRWGEAAPLSGQAGAIGRALAESTTFKHTSAASRALGLRAGRMMVLVETRASASASMWATGADGDGAAHRVTLPGPKPERPIEIEFGTMAIERVECPLVLLRTAEDDRGLATRDVRTHLCRLHAEREVLTQVLRASNKGKITEATGALERYLTQAKAELFATSRFGVAQDELRQLFDVYDRITPAETTALKNVLDGRTQSIGRVETLVQTYRDVDGRPTIYYLEAGAQIIMNDNRVNVAGNNSGVINVAGTFTNTGTIIQGAEDAHLKTALTELKSVTERMVGQIPDPAKQQSVANKLETLTKEATSKEPDHDMLQVTGKGLIEAAKTVGEMAAPIAKAVGVVLGIFGVLL